ncbi:MAG: winged helix-turn-helix domain-containing protein [Candidatus Cyclobacteriaceae bacterium M3_2C_046]
MKKFENLDPLLHSQLRLAIIAILISVEDADFVYIKEQTNATAGNLSVQISKLEEAGYIEVRKQFKGKMPQTICKITPKGIEQFEKYVNSLKNYIDPQ